MLKGPLHVLAAPAMQAFGVRPAPPPTVAVDRPLRLALEFLLLGVARRPVLPPTIRLGTPEQEARMKDYKRPDKSIPRSVGHHKEWIEACKNPSLKTACDFEYSGNMIEQLLLGLVAYRTGKKLVYDGATGKVTNSSEANALLSRKYRAGWTLNG